MSKIKHLQKRSDFQFLRLRPYDVASIATIPGKNDYASSFFVSETLAYNGVKQTHVYFASPPTSASLSTISWLRYLRAFHQWSPVPPIPPPWQLGHGPLLRSA